MGEKKYIYKEKSVMCEAAAESLAIIRESAMHSEDVLLVDLDAPDVDKKLTEALRDGGISAFLDWLGAMLDKVYNDQKQIVKEANLAKDLLRRMGEVE